MEKKRTLTLDKEFVLYCELNNLTDIDKVAKETFNRGFALLKYGETPVGGTTVKEKIIEIIKEVPVEVIVEKEVKVPYEVIKEVIKEVKIPAKEKNKTVIKEVPVEIIKEVINTEEIDILKKENEKLKKELEEISKSLNNFNKARYMKNSDLGSLYGE